MKFFLKVFRLFLPAKTRRPEPRVDLKCFESCPLKITSALASNYSLY